MLGKALCHNFRTSITKNNLFLSKLRTPLSKDQMSSSHIHPVRCSPCPGWWEWCVFLFCSQKFSRHFCFPECFQWKFLNDDWSQWAYHQHFDAIHEQLLSCSCGARAQVCWIESLRMVSAIRCKSQNDSRFLAGTNRFNSIQASDSCSQQGYTVLILKCSWRKLCRSFTRMYGIWPNFSDLNLNAPSKTRMTMTSGWIFLEFEASCTLLQRMHSHLFMHQLWCGVFYRYKFRELQILHWRSPFQAYGEEIWAVHQPPMVFGCRTYLCFQITRLATGESCSCSQALQGSGQQFVPGW